jgi:hypothetical protein
MSNRQSRVEHNNQLNMASTLETLQTQINNKAGKIDPAFLGTVLLYDNLVFNSAEYQTTYSFGFDTGQANQKIDILLPGYAFTAVVDIELTGSNGLDSEDSTGLLAKRYVFATNDDGTQYGTDSHYTEAIGAITNKFAFSPGIVWDPATPRYKITIGHLTSIGGWVTLKIRVLSRNDGFQIGIGTIGLSSVYTTDDTVYPVAVLPTSGSSYNPVNSPATYI